MSRAIKFADDPPTYITRAESNKPHGWPVTSWFMSQQMFISAYTYGSSWTRCLIRLFFPPCPSLLWAPPTLAATKKRGERSQRVPVSYSLSLAGAAAHAGPRTHSTRSLSLPIHPHSRRPLWLTEHGPTLHCACVCFVCLPVKPS